MPMQREDIAAAVTRRMANMRVTAPSQTLYMDFDEEHDLRQAFRRRIDREILEGNRPAVAIESLKVNCPSSRLWTLDATISCIGRSAASPEYTGVPR